MTAVRVTLADLAAALERYKTALEMAGLPADGLHVGPGFGHGRGYWWRLTDHTGQAPIGPTILGATKREAFGTLETVTETMEDVLGVLWYALDCPPQLCDAYVNQPDRKNRQEGTES